LSFIDQTINKYFWFAMVTNNSDRKIIKWRINLYSGLKATLFHFLYLCFSDQEAPPSMTKLHAIADQVPMLSNLFTLSLIFKANKLGCLSLTSFIQLVVITAIITKLFSHNSFRFWLRLHLLNCADKSFIAIGQRWAFPKISHDRPVHIAKDP